MGGSLNKAMVMGNLGQDPELRHTKNNMAVCNFSIATSEFTGRGDEKERTEWHRIVVWGRQAEVCAEHLKKGRKVFVEGRMQSRKYEGKDGIERQSFEIVARDIQFLGGKDSGDSQSYGGRDPADNHGVLPTVVPLPKKKPVDLGIPLHDDDIPF